MPFKKNTESLTCLQETVAMLGAPNNVSKTKKACVVESLEYTRQRVEPSLLKGHVDHIAGKGHTSMNHYNFVRNFSLAESIDISDATAAVEKEWTKLDTIQEVVPKARRNKNQVHFKSLMDFCHLKTAEVEPKFASTKVGSYLLETL